MPFQFELKEQDESEPLLERHGSSCGWKNLHSQEHRKTRGRKIAVVLCGLFVAAMLLVLVTEYVSGSWQSDSDENKTDIPTPTGSHPDPTEEEIKEALKEAEELVAQRKKLEKLLHDKGIVLKKGSAAFYHQLFLKGKGTKSEEAAECEIILEHLTRKLGKSGFKVTLPERCQPNRPRSCPSSIYRTYDGSCNNIKNPTWGMAMTPYRRMLNPAYADGVSTPRLAKDGNQLPSARLLSSKLYNHRSRPECNCTLLTMLFGLYVDHEITKTAAQLGHKGSGITCCDPQVLHNSSLRHPECLPIEVPLSDPFYGPLNITCLEFVRSSPAPGSYSGQREQLNQVTCFLDGSAIYGSSLEEAKKLRSFINGQLRTSTMNESEMLPKVLDMSSFCGSPKQGLFCFEAGDSRVNEQVELTAMHMLLMRQHNRIASQLHVLNPIWNDEKTFQETRRIVIAELQNIIYREYLPVMLGPDTIRQHNLDTKENLFDYNANMNPSLYNVFATAIYRFGHSMIQGTMKLIATGDTTVHEVPLHETFFNPHLLYKEGLDPLLRGLVNQKSLAVQSYITPEVRNRLFQPEKGHHGLDLSALGIQRGRDHALPSYTNWRRVCGLPDVKEWDDLHDVIDNQHVEKLKRLYKHVDDVDLIPAALAERPLPGALVGPTHACILRKQFDALKHGDRFFFSVKNQPGSFRDDQIEELRKSNLARLICDNSDDIQEIQILPLRPVSEKNPTVNCSQIPAVDLKLWAV